MEFNHPIPRIAFTKIQKIRMIVDDNPNCTLQDIADKLSVSRERVRQLINMNNEYSSLYKYTNGDYGLPRINRLGKGVSQKYKCNSCGAKRTHPLVKCKDCRKRDLFEIVICHNCKKEVKFTGNKARHFRNNTKVLKFGNRFCSRQCASSYSGRHYGFGTTMKKG